MRIFQGINRSYVSDIDRLFLADDPPSARPSEARLQEIRRAEIISTARDKPSAQQTADPSHPRPRLWENF